jgi:hypothetical protein
VAPGRVRVFEPGDIPQVAALRRRLFPVCAPPSQAAEEAYFDLIFFRNPWRALDLPAHVYEDRSGRITGFLGVIPRPMRYQGEPVRLAVSTQYMAEPGPASIPLLARHLDGPQDLGFSDLANDTARTLWQGLGGDAALIYSLYWDVPLRPARHALSLLGDHTAVRAVRLAARPLVAAMDKARRAAARGARRFQRPGGLRTTSLEARDIVELLPATTAGHTLVPVYDEAAVRWLLDRLEERYGPGSVRGRVVRESDGQPVGWYLYQRYGLVAEVVQIAAHGRRWSDVLQVLLADGWDDGLALVTGRLEPAHADTLAALGCRFRRDPNWTLTHARRPEILSTLLSGRAFMSRLDAEWWVNF